MFDHKTLGAKTFLKELGKKRATEREEKMRNKKKKSYYEFLYLLSSYSPVEARSLTVRTAAVMVMVLVEWEPKNRKKNVSFCVF